MFLLCSPPPSLLGGRVAPERTGDLLLEELMVENHAIMMYSPLLEGSGE